MKTLLNKSSLIIASGAGSGFAPIASGTFGTLAYLGLYYVLTLFFETTLLLNIAIFFFILIFGTATTRHCLNKKLGENFSRKKLSVHKTKESDPSYVVIDEWAGMHITLMFCTNLCLANYLLAFILFRFFDVLKPPPVKQLEELPGAWGVMLDDVAAGILAGIFLLLINVIFNFC